MLSPSVSYGRRPGGVLTNNQKGRGSGPCLLWVALDKASHIVPIALLFGALRVREALFEHIAIEGTSTALIVISMFNGSYCRRRERLSIFIPTIGNSVRVRPSIFCRVDHCRRPSERVLQRHILESIFHQIWTYFTKFELISPNLNRSSEY